MSANDRSGEIEEEFVIPSPSGDVPEAVFGVARDADGKMYIAVTMYREIPAGYYLLVVRLDANNFPDSSYGIDGYAEVFFDGLLKGAVFGLSMVLQEDGGIVIVGKDRRHIPFVALAGLARLKGNGQLDGAFGSSGTIVHAFNYARSSLGDHPVNRLNAEASDVRIKRMSASGQKIATLASGKILYCVGAGEPEYDQPYVGIISRFMPDGSLDESFGQAGVLVIEHPVDKDSDLGFTSIIELADGQLAACGWGGSFLEAGGVVFRCSENGLPDNAFGDGGFVAIKLPEWGPLFPPLSYGCNSIVEGPDSSLICSGTFFAVSADGREFSYGVVTNLEKSGVQLPSFNNGQPVFFSVLGRLDRFVGIALQSDNKIVATGDSFVSGSSPDQRDFLVARFNPDGSKDHSFARVGWVTHSFLSGDNRAETMMLDGEAIVVVGTNAIRGEEIKIIVMRFNG